MFVELSILGLLQGWPVHMHVEGLRGTGKTTILRAAQAILPPITRVKGCIYNCHPLRPHCPLHAGLNPVELANLGTETVPRPFLEISHSAKMGTVVGTLDLKRLTDSSEPEARILPGTLPKAHRGIVFVDEINRIADTSPELTDVLLDVMGTKPGRVQIEESGLPPVTLPLEVSVWAASNPDEDPGPLSDIRRQLSDRFDFVIQMGRPQQMKDILNILRRGHEAKEEQDLDNVIRSRLAAATTEGRGQLEFPPEHLSALAQLYLSHHLESLRSVEALKVGAVLHAAWSQQSSVKWSNIVAVAAAALRHRVRPEELNTVLAELDKQGGPGENATVDGVPRRSQQASGPGLAVSDTRSRQKVWSGWQSFWDRWRQRGRLGAGEATETGSDRVSLRSPQGKSAGTSTDDLGRGQNPLFPDPLDVPLVAPPQAARPLASVEPSQALLTAEVETTDGKD